MGFAMEFYPAINGAYNHGQIHMGHFFDPNIWHDSSNDALNLGNREDKRSAAFHSNVKYLTS